MASTISGSIYFTGLDSSGNDWAQTLEQLKQIESININRLEAWKSDWNLRYQAFTKVIEAAQTTRTALDGLKSRNNFIDKTVVSTNTTVLTGTATADAIDGQHMIKVEQTASNSVWASTHKFAAKDAKINTSGVAQTFSYSYAGKTYSMEVASGTTLESFMHLVNNSSDNPGVKISLLKNVDGYYFQIAGKDTGAKNNLVVHATQLEGFDTNGTNSLWESNSVIKSDDPITNPSKIQYELTLKNGAKSVITVDGTSSIQDLVDTINGKLGPGTATLDPTGNIDFKNIQSISKKNANETTDVYKAPFATLSYGSQSDINNGYIVAKDNTDEYTVQVTLNDPSLAGGQSTIEFKVKGGDKRSDLITKLAAATGNSASMSMDEHGAYSLTLSNVTNINITDPGNAPATLTGLNLTYDAGNTTGITDRLYAEATKINNATLNITFDATKLTEKISNSDPTLMKEYVLIKTDGSSVNFTLNGDATYQDLYDELKNNQGFTEDPGDPNKLVGAGIKRMSLIAGLDSAKYYTKELECTTTMNFNDVVADNLPPEANVGDTKLEAPQDLEYKFTANDGTSHTITVASGSTLADIVSAFHNAIPPVPNVQLYDKDNKQVIDPATAGSGSYHLQVQDGSISGPKISGQVVESTNWNIQKSTNAKFYVDNYPVALESETNTITEAIEGVTFNIYDVGDAKLSINTDLDSVSNSIQEFLDAVNTLILTVQTFTKYDSSANTTTNDPNKKDSNNYSMSQLTAEKGGLLQGNYGIQLFDSNFMSTLTGKPSGYTARTSAKDVLSGDLISSLSSLGIKVCSDEQSDNYGLLMIGAPANISEIQELDKATYNEMLTKHLNDVLDFFCGPEVAGTTSTNAFRYSSSISGITAPGVYDVQYEVNTNGDIVSVMIDGHKAVNDPAMGSNYFTSDQGPAKGTAIYIDDLTPGTHAGQLRIKEGLVRTVDNFLKQQLNYTNVGNGTDADSLALKANNGGLMILQANYQAIMDGIDVKIDRERLYLENWEKHQKDKFARLQTLLSSLDASQKQIEGQLKQLDNK